MSKVCRSESRAGSVIWLMRPTTTASRVRGVARLLRPPRLTGPWARASTGKRLSGLRTGRMALLGQTFSHMPQPTQACSMRVFCLITGRAKCSAAGSGKALRETVTLRCETPASMALKVHAATQEPHMVQRSAWYSMVQRRSLTLTSWVFTDSIAAPPDRCR